MNIFNRNSYLFLLLTVLVSCYNNEKSINQPENVLPKDQFTDALEEFLYVQTYYKNSKSNNIDKENYLETVFTKSKITRDDFDRSLSYYSHQKEYNAMLDSVKININKRLNVYDSVYTKSYNHHINNEDLISILSKDSITYKWAISEKINHNQFIDSIESRLDSMVFVSENKKYKKENIILALKLNAYKPTYFQNHIRNKIISGNNTKP